VLHLRRGAVKDPPNAASEACHYGIGSGSRDVIVGTACVPPCRRRAG